MDTHESLVNKFTESVRDLAEYHLKKAKEVGFNPEDAKETEISEMHDAIERVIAEIEV